MLRSLLTALIAIAITACSAVDVEDYAGREPRLRADEFFNGQLTAHGVLKDRAGRVTRSFNARIEASWDNGVGTLDEHFVFDDGETQRRVWTLRPDGENRYIGSAGDVSGPATLRQAGNSIFLDYVLQVPWRGDVIEVKVDDRMYLVSPDVLVNESRLSKFGFHVGDLLLVILRDDR
ncbi:DUF3833 domain-containing protein [Mangrovimicrobium sediminis]|uniref:DUF3833 domain-containing protein n=1 Tax=Mangrovimicrobium sediminis TaxID=2562682 RepID=A0A4Z0M158_9GAMM|nr:DUF3833 domain-containing protein [Haliea sp. SAOS-164]TGD73342.1 DUF3833 domain-containing protein [Haliea sp. SAOS-164]